MYFHSLAILPFALFQLASAANSTIYDVTVGANAQLVFSPNIVTAGVGDKVNFHFFPKNHSVSQSTFGAPCVPSTSFAIFSGFQPTTSENADVFTITVNDTKPIWIYCAQGTHCESGMAMVINQPASPNTLANYLIAAKNAKTITPSTVGGGVFSENLSSGAGSISASSSASSSLSSSISSFVGASGTSTLSSAGTSSTSTESSNSGSSSTVAPGSASSATASAVSAPSGATDSSGSSTIAGTTASSTSTGPATQKSNGAAGTGMQWGALSLLALLFGGLLV
ncbi:hypothetical protein MMC34_003267 [Xylographa carneopallida]|nr:hypothetical protein [Xylographa carneopallida]